MPSMNEIYDGHAIEYDELVDREDHEGNLRVALDLIFDFSGKTVIELGCGTGRLTRCYIDRARRAFCFDRSTHMLGKFKINLGSCLSRIELGVLDNLQRPPVAEKADCVIEGWSFGHSVVENRDDIEGTTDRLVAHCESLLAPGGSAIIIETLGSNVEAPAPPSRTLAAFYERLERVHGFRRNVISTDYRFPSADEASRAFAFFFGEAFASGIRERRSGIVPEFTGIWHKSIS